MVVSLDVLLTKRPVIIMVANRPDLNRRKQFCGLEVGPCLGVLERPAKRTALCKMNLKSRARHFKKKTLVDLTLFCFAL
jgi:hypothetical protein